MELPPQSPSGEFSDSQSDNHETPFEDSRANRTDTDVHMVYQRSASPVMPSQPAHASDRHRSASSSGQLPPPREQSPVSSSAQSMLPPPQQPSSARTQPSALRNSGRAIELPSLGEATWGRSPGGGRRTLSAFESPSNPNSGRGRRHASAKQIISRQATCVDAHATGESARARFGRGRAFPLYGILAIAPCIALIATAAIISSVMLSELAPRYESTMHHAAMVTVARVANTFSRQLTEMSDRAMGLKLELAARWPDAATPSVMAARSGTARSTAFLRDVTSMGNALGALTSTSFGTLTVVFNDGSFAGTVSSTLAGLPSTYASVSTVGMWSQYPASPNASSSGAAAPNGAVLYSASNPTGQNVPLTSLSYGTAISQQVATIMSDTRVSLVSAWSTNSTRQWGDSAVALQPLISTGQLSLPLMPIGINLCNASGNRIGIINAVSAVPDIQSVLNGAMFDAQIDNIATFLVDDNLLVLGTSIAIPQLAFQPASGTGQNLYCSVPTPSPSQHTLLNFACQYRGTSFPYSNDLNQVAADEGFQDVFSRVLATRSDPVLMKVAGALVVVARVDVQTNVPSGTLAVIGIRPVSSQPLPTTTSVTVVCGSLAVALLLALLALAFSWRFTRCIVALTTILRKTALLEDVDEHQFACVTGPSGGPKEKLNDPNPRAEDTKEGDPMLMSDFMVRGSNYFREVYDLEVTYQHTLMSLAVCSMYLPDDALRHIAAHGTAPNSALRRITGSVVHAALDEFAVVAAGLSVDRLIEVMALYSATVHAVVAEHDGLVERIVGDQVTAVWCVAYFVPNHETKAALTALRIAQTMNVPPSAGTKTPTTIEVRCGVCSGEMFCGAVGGASSRTSFAVIGTSFAIAAKLAWLAASRFHVRVLAAHTTMIGLPPQCIVGSLMCAIDIEESSIALQNPDVQIGDWRRSTIARTWSGLDSFSDFNSDGSSVRSGFEGGHRAHSSPTVPDLAPELMNNGYLPVYGLFGIAIPNADDNRYLISRESVVSRNFLLDGAKNDESDSSTHRTSRLPRTAADMVARLRSGKGSSTVALLERAVQTMRDSRVASDKDLALVADISSAVAQYLSNDVRGALSRMDATCACVEAEATADPSHANSGVLRVNGVSQRRSSEAGGTADQRMLAFSPTIAAQVRGTARGFRAVLAAELQQQLSVSPAESGRRHLTGSDNSDRLAKEGSMGIEARADAILSDGSVRAYSAPETPPFAQSLASPLVVFDRLAPGHVALDGPFSPESSDSDEAGRDRSLPSPARRSDALGVTQPPTEDYVI